MRFFNAFPSTESASSVSQIFSFTVLSPGIFPYLVLLGAPIPFVP